MNKKEEILKLLERDARLSTEEVAVMIGLSVEDTAEAIADLEKEKVILGYSTRSEERRVG